MPIDRRKPFRCPHCGALIVWGWDGDLRVPLDVVSMKVTNVSHMTTCKQIAGWSKQDVARPATQTETRIYE